MDNDKSTRVGGLHVVVFAGPNGSGKTSLIDEIRASGLRSVGGVFPLPTHFINPDQVAKDLPGHFDTQDERDRAAAKAAYSMRAKAIESNEPFAFETVMSHPSRINELLMLKERGYHLLLTFITTDNPEKNVERVTLRYQTGTTTGHYVPPDKVRDRYHRTLALLPKAAEISDVVFVYDNTADFAKPSLQAVIEQDLFSISPDAKPWVHDKLVLPLQERELQLHRLSDQVRERGYAVREANLLDGQYDGPVLLQTGYYVAQLDNASGYAVIHDRVMLDATAKKRPLEMYKENEAIRISYSRQDGPHVMRPGVEPELQPSNVAHLPRPAKR
jgi:predicted ABC-type ATPase